MVNGNAPDRSDIIKGLVIVPGHFQCFFEFCILYLQLNLINPKFMDDLFRGFILELLGRIGRPPSLSSVESLRILELFLFASMCPLSHKSKSLK